MKNLQKLLSSVRQALDHYNMISEGEKIAVGLSGGKDSAALLCALARMKDFYPKKYDLCAVSVDMGFAGADDFFYPMKKLCSDLDVEYHIVKTQIAQIVFNEKQEKNPCSLCAKLRRGALNNEAASLGAKKIALGHHLDDAVETFMMSLMHEGRIGCFSPVTVYEDTGISVIRPLIYTKESDIKSFVRANSIEIPHSPCPENHNTEREKMKEFLHPFEVEKRGTYKRILGAMERREIDGWF
ncbi:MAG: adenine nucleotide alpha hydrolase family protein [Ruminococcaceae bacterium]|nr:adenine nucleotide alpha hydrolase family protein [Oscillospiraceae bacterium]